MASTFPSVAFPNVGLSYPIPVTLTSGSTYPVYMPRLKTTTLIDRFERLWRYNLAKLIHSSLTLNERKKRS